MHTVIRHILFATYCKNHANPKCIPPSSPSKMTPCDREVEPAWLWYSSPEVLPEKRGWDMIESFLWGLATPFQMSLKSFSHTLTQRLRIKNVKGRADIRPSMRRCFFGNFWRALHSSGVQQFSKNQKLLSGGLSFQTIEFTYLKWIYKHSGCEQIHSSLSLYHPSIIRALSEFPNTQLAKISRVHISHY